MRFLLALLIATALAAPVQGQFAVTVQQNGQAFSVTSGGSITLNAPAVGGIAAATVRLTYIGSATAVFPSTGQILGSANIVATGDTPNTLTQLQSKAFTLTYAAADAAQAASFFSWPFNEVTTTVNGATATSGTISFNLIGTAPNLTVGEVAANGTFQVVANVGNIQFPDTVTGASSSVTIAIANPGSGSGTVNSISATGPYQLGGVPLLPLVVNAGGQFNITAQFLPVSSGLNTGSLQIAFGSGTYTAALSGNGVASFLTYQVIQGGTTSPLNPNQTITLANTNPGSKSSAIIQFQNTSTVPTTLSNVAISGTGFSITDEPFLPITLQPQQSDSVTLTYAPLQPGQSTGRLLIGNDNFSISGSASAPPPLPSYQFTGASGAQQPFQQPAIGMSLSAPYPLALSGTLTLTIASSSFDVDPAVQFSSGGRQTTFSIPANTLDAVFPNGAKQIRFQTGTVAGSMQITPTFTVGSGTGTDITPPNAVSLQLTVPSAVPTLLTSVLGTRTTTGFSIITTGFSTTRFLDHFTFQLTPAGGFALSGTSFPVDVSAAATVWFQSSASQSLGGQFTVEIPFSLAANGTSTTGTDLTKSLSGVSVTATNDVGASNVVQVAIP